MHERVKEVRISLGINVRRKREKSGLTQAQLAGLMNIEPRTLQRLEAGHTTSLTTVVLTADALEVSVASLFRHVKKPNRRKPGRPKQQY